MGFIQTVVGLRGDGARKKRLVLAIVRKIVTTEIPFANESDRASIEALLLPGGLVDTGIDVLVGAARGAIKKVGVSGCCTVA